MITHSKSKILIVLLLIVSVLGNRLPQYCRLANVPHYPQIPYCPDVTNMHDTINVPIISSTSIIWSLKQYSISVSLDLNNDYRNVAASNKTAVMLCNKVSAMGEVYDADCQRTCWPVNGCSTSERCCGDLSWTKATACWGECRFPPAGDCWCSTKNTKLVGCVTGVYSPTGVTHCAKMSTYAIGKYHIEDPDSPIIKTEEDFVNKWNYFRTTGYSPFGKRALIPTVQVTEVQIFQLAKLSYLVKINVASGASLVAFSRGKWQQIVQTTDPAKVVDIEPSVLLEDGPMTALIYSDGVYIGQNVYDLNDVDPTPYKNETADERAKRECTICYRSYTHWSERSDWQKALIAVLIVFLVVLICMGWPILLITLDLLFRLYHHSMSLAKWNFRVMRNSDVLQACGSKIRDIKDKMTPKEKKVIRYELSSVDVEDAVFEEYAEKKFMSLSKKGFPIIKKFKDMSHKERKELLESGLDEINSRMVTEEETPKRKNSKGSKVSMRPIGSSFLLLCLFLVAAECKNYTFIPPEVREMNVMRAQNSGDNNYNKIVELNAGDPFSMCTSTSFHTTSLTECVADGKEQTCKMKYAVNGKNQFKESVACMMLKNSNNETITKVTMRYKQLLSLYQLNFKYFTSNYKRDVMAALICGGTEPCGTSGSNTNWCATHDFQSDFTAGGKLSGEGVDRPGVTWCTHGSQCVNPSLDDCVSCNSRCYVLRVYWKPEGDIYAVYSLGNFKSFPTLEFNVTYENNTRFSYTFNASSDIVSLENMVFRFNGAYASLSGDIFGTKDVVVNSRTFESFYTETSQVGVPQEGQIGDIQSTNPEKLFSQTRDAFAFVQNPGTCTIGGGSVGCLYPTTGLNQRLEFADHLPINTSNGFYSISNDLYLVQRWVSPGGVDWDMETTQPFELTRVVTLVCPIINFVSVSGCYSCNDGFKLSLQGWSHCSAGNLPFSTIGFYCSSDNLILGLGANTTVEQQCYTSSENLNGKFEYRDESGNKQLVVITGKLNFKLTLSQDGLDAAKNKVKDTAGDAWSSFGDFFRNIDLSPITAADKLKMAAFIIGLFGVTAFIIWIFIQYRKGKIAKRSQLFKTPNELDYERLKKSDDRKN